MRPSLQVSCVLCLLGLHVTSAFKQCCVATSEFVWVLVVIVIYYITTWESFWL